MKIKFAKMELLFLPQIVEISVALENVFLLQFLEIIFGDLNQDNKVNSLDFQILIQKFKETQNIEIEDLNSDGIVDIKDIGILMHYWNE